MKYQKTKRLIIESSFKEKESNRSSDVEMLVLGSTWKLGNLQVKNMAQLSWTSIAVYYFIVQECIEASNIHTANKISQ